MKAQGSTKVSGKCMMCSACKSAPPWAPERLKELPAAERRKVLENVNKRVTERRERRKFASEDGMKGESCTSLSHEVEHEDSLTLGTGVSQGKVATETVMTSKNSYAEQTDLVVTKVTEEDDAANQLTYQLERTEFRDKIAVFSAKDPNTETVSLSQETEEIADQHNLKLDSLLTPQLSEASIADSTSGYVERTVSDVERQAVTLVNMTSPATNRRSLRDSDWIKERSAVLLEDDAASRSRSGQVHAEEQPRESTTKGAGSSPPFSASQATEKQLLSPSRRVNESIPTEIIDHVQVESYPAPVNTSEFLPTTTHCRSCDQLRGRLRASETKINKLKKSVAKRDVVISRLRNASGTPENILRQEIERLRMTCEYLYHRLETIEDNPSAPPSNR